MINTLAQKEQIKTGRNLDFKSELTQQEVAFRTCGECRHAQRIEISRVFYRCSLWDEIVKQSDLACSSMTIKSESGCLSGEQ